MGERPNLTIFGEEGKERSVLVTSPFSNKVKALKLADGEQIWANTLVERVPYAALPLTDGVIVEGDQGTVWAFNNTDGEILWKQLAPDSWDYPMGPPRYREGAVFTISHRGTVRRLERSGKATRSVIRDLDWGDKKAEDIPFRSNRPELIYLDQSSRLTIYDPDTLSLLSSKDLIQDRRADLLAGALPENGELAWVVELPGVLRAIQPESGQEVWESPVWREGDLWSTEAELLSVPSPLSSPGGGTSVLLATRRQATLFDGADGSVLGRLKLPSPAVHTPVYDRATRLRWILCERHLVSVSPRLSWRTYDLPLVDTPFTMEAGENRITVGTVDGRVYMLKFPSPTDAASSK